MKLYNDKNCFVEEGNHQSPLVVRRTYEGQLLGEELAPPPISVIKKSVKEHHEVTFGSPVSSRRNHKPKSILHKTDPIPMMSPRYEFLILREWF